MKKNADRTAPHTNFRMWADNGRFFNKCTSRQWEGVLSADSLALMDEEEFLKPVPEPPEDERPLRRPKGEPYETYTEAQADVVLQKPIELPELEKLVDDLLAKK